MGIFSKNKQPVIPMQVPQATPSDLALTNAEAQLETNFNQQPQQGVQYKPQLQEVAPVRPQMPIEQQLQQPKEEKVVVQQVPIYLDDSAINNLVIENNLMLKELLRIANE